MNKENYFHHNKVTPKDDVTISVMDNWNKCAACGKRDTTDMIAKLCVFEKVKLMYCDSLCFHWRYFDPKNNPDRYKRSAFNTDMFREMIKK